MHQWASFKGEIRFCMSSFRRMRKRLHKGGDLVRGKSNCLQDHPDSPSHLVLNQLRNERNTLMSSKGRRLETAGIHCLWLQLFLKGTLEQLLCGEGFQKYFLSLEAIKNRNGCLLCLHPGCCFLACIRVGITTPQSVVFLNDF